MYPREAIDFDGLPAATQARIRERLAYRGTDAARKDVRVCMEMPADAVTGRQPPTITDRLCHAPNNQPLGAAGQAGIKPGHRFHHTQPEGGE